MKNLLLLLIFFIPGILNAQVADDFSDGNFTLNPSWTGDTGHFEVNSAFQLHLRSTGNDTGFLVTPVTLCNETEWNFWIKLSFNTTANNHARVYLVADQPDLTCPLKGYYVQIGGSADSVSFFRQNDETRLPLLHVKHFSTAHSVNQFRFKIIRSESGTWTLFADSTGNSDYLDCGTFHDDMEINAGHCGIYCRYTSSNAEKIYFDDLYVGPVIRDTIAPVVTAFNILNPKQMVITWSEPIDITTASDTANYKLLHSSKNPLTASPDPENQFRTFLTFADPLPDPGCDSLYITGIADISGNIIQDTLMEVCYYRAGTFDILIQEIMADPEPANSLPACEYIELFNNSDHPVSLYGWSLTLGKSTKFFPEVSILSKSYLILSPDSSMHQYGPSLTLFNTASQLSNEGSSLVLKDDSGRIIHAIAYSNKWFDGSFKEEGGWSLEMKDPGNPCGCSENWSPSMNPAGGTPGKINSVAEPVPDITPPGVRRGMILDEHLAGVVFSEDMDSISLLEAAAFELQPGGAHPVSVAPVPPGYREVRLTFDTSFLPGSFYSLLIHHVIRDCAGNYMGEEKELNLAIPGTAVPGSIVVNEILTEPYAGGSRFIEFFNIGETPVDLRDLSLGYEKEGGESLFRTEPLASILWLLFPGKYVAICRDCDDVIARYPACEPEYFLSMESMPVLSSENGIVRLVRKADEMIIDRFAYSRSQHDPLLSNTEGVSLERIDPYRPASDATNWHSAARTAGYATPGATNSQYFRGSSGQGAIRLDPLVFSPDNDGTDDVLSVTCNLEQPGMKASVYIYNSKGVMIRQLANTILAEPHFAFTWDGTTDARIRAPAGIYIVFVQVADNNGNTRSYKATATLATKL